MSHNRRIFVADTFALIVFGFIFGGAIELLTGLTLAQALQSRLLSIPVNMVVARPYGIFRDWIMKVGGAEQGGAIRKIALDMTAFCLFQMPVYMSILATTGATLETILAASAGQIGGVLMIARPYGLWMQFCRKQMLAGLSAS